MADGGFQTSATVPLGIGARHPGPLWQIAGWAGFDTHAGALLQDLGLPGIGTYRVAQSAGSVTSWRIAPDRILIEGADDLGKLHSEDVVVLDLSHAREVIQLTGPAARDVLAQLTAVDVSAPAFEPGHFLQLGIHGIGVLLTCLSDESFELFVPSSWAASLRALILENARPYGVQARQLE